MAKKTDTEPKEVLFKKSSTYINGKLYETIIDDGRTSFVYLDNDPRILTDEYSAYMSGLGYTADKFRCFKTFRINNFIPQSGDELFMDPPMVMLPSCPLPFDSPTILVQEMVDFIKRYCDLPDDFARISAYYAILTYFYDRLDQVPYLSFMGDLGTGKSRCKLMVGSLCYHATLASAGTTPAAMYRLIDKWPGTLLMDEADMNDKSDEAQEIAKILNCGFDKYNPRVLCDKDDANNLLFNNPFCPKIIARRFEFKDKAIESRCITQVMYQTERRDLPKVLPPCWIKEAEILRNKLAMLRLLYWHTYDNPKSDILSIDIEPRLLQAYTGLALVVSQFPGELEWLKGYLLQKNAEIINERASTYEGALINAYFDCVQEKKEVITATVLAGKMSETLSMEVKTRSIGRILKALGFLSTKRKLSGIWSRVVSINPDKFLVLCKKYGVGETSETFETFILPRPDTSIVPKTALFTKNLQVNVSNVYNVSNVSFDNIEPHIIEILQTEKTKEYDKLVFELFKKGGWPEKHIEETLEKMKREGSIYEPRSGFISKMM